jgi:RNA polymerase sigma-70 factor (ECF subfamily)
VTGERNIRDGRGDEELMVAFREGEAEAFELLYRRWERGVYNYVLRFLGDPGRAAEVTQETFLAVVRNRRRYRPLARFATYLFRIAHHRATAVIRRRKVRAERPLVGPVVERPPDRESVLAVRDALARLPERYREVVVLREFHGLSYDELAEVAGVPVGTVRSRLHRARAAMLEILETREEAPEP